MILDSSAILAILQREPEHEALVERLDAAQHLAVGAPTLVETAIIVEARLRVDSRAVLGRFLEDFGVSTIDFGPAHWREAAGAFRRFGKGRHPAALSFGDCLTYAVARLADRPLLCVGEDFRKTDLALA